MDTCEDLGEAAMTRYRKHMFSAVLKFWERSSKGIH